MWLIVGLGNPGNHYCFNRHNIGYIFIDFILNSFSITKEKKNHFKSDVFWIDLFDKNFLLVKPKTYMNNSGEAIRAIKDYYKIDFNNLLVVHDDLDQDFGYIKLQYNRGHGGHNGIKSINQHIASKEYFRIKIGINNLINKQNKINTSNFVLQDFNKDEKKYLPDILNASFDALEVLIKEDFNKACNLINKKNHIE